MNKIFKYRLLRHLPGKVGRRYGRKLENRLRPGRNSVALAEFADAVRSNRGKTCIDLGANLGVYTRQMALSAKTVIAFEPDPWTFAELSINVADLENVVLMQAAASICDATVALYRGPDFGKNPNMLSQSSSIVEANPSVVQESAAEVQQIDFIRFLSELNEDIGIIKIDIEGAEFELLEALFDSPEVLGRIDYVFAETHEAIMPEFEDRAASLRERARGVARPRINMYWP